MNTGEINGKQIVSNEYINIKIVSEKIREWNLLQL
jgi:hypothetical protein